ncbi:hypothetical protein TNCV_2792821 [Trichonephila clavipes]|nr:hypothetical protein TNCV_2792821 [Trichonephila clavipes]
MTKKALNVKQRNKKVSISGQFIKESGLTRTVFILPTGSGVQLVGLKVSVNAMENRAVLNLSCPDMLLSEREVSLKDSDLSRQGNSLDGCRFVEWAQNEMAVVPDFHKRILFSDEAHFWLNGYVNKQNCRISSEANPQVYVETPLHPEKLTVWCALRAGGILLQKR